MARYEVTAPNGQKFEITAPDGATQDQVMAYAQQQFAQSAANSEQVQQPAYPEVPTAENLAASQQYYDQQSSKQPEERSMLDRIKGAGEVALALGSGATTGLAGGIVGGLAGIGQSIKQGTFGTSEGADRAQMVAEQSMAGSTYSPRTEAGQEYLQRIGEALSPLESLPPVGVNQLTGRVAAIPQAQRLAKKQEFKIDESLIYDNPEDAQRAALNKAVPVTKRIDPKNPEKQINDDLAISAIRQGFDENFIQALKGLSLVDRKQVLKMATTIDRGENDYLISRYNRPSDVVGEALSDKVRFVKQKNEEAGSEIDKAASKLDGDIDFTDPVNSFLSDLDSLGVKLDENFTPNFKGSDTLGADRRVIREVLSRMKGAKDSSPKEAHKMKRFIDRMVIYGQTSQGSLGRDVSSSLKKLRSGLDERLDSAFPDYKAANDSYRETIQALDDYQQAAGKSIDIFSSDSAVGTRVVNALLSNQQGRENIQKAISQIDSVAKKHGGEFNDDILAQAAIANDLENIYKTQGKSSLGGIFARTADDIIDRGVMATAYKKGADIVRKSEKQRRQDSLKALKKLLMREDQ